MPYDIPTWNRERSYPDGSFSEWLAAQHERDDAVGELAKRVRLDTDWPEHADSSVDRLARYLDSRWAPPELVDALTEAWEERYPPPPAPEPVPFDPPPSPPPAYASDGSGHQQGPVGEAALALWRVARAEWDRRHGQVPVTADQENPQ